MGESASTAEPGKGNRQGGGQSLEVTMPKINLEKIGERGSQKASQETSAEKGEIKQHLTLKEIFQVLKTHANSSEGSSKWVNKWRRSTFEERRGMEAEAKKLNDKKEALEKRFNLEAEQYFPKGPGMPQIMIDSLPRHERDTTGPWIPFKDRPKLEKAEAKYKEDCNRACEEHKQHFSRQNSETQRDWIEKELLMGLKYGRHPMSLHQGRFEDFMKLYGSVSREDRRQIFTLLARDRVGSEYPPSMDPRELEQDFEDYIEVMKMLKRARDVKGIEEMPIAKFGWRGVFEKGENENTPDDKLSEEAKRHGTEEKEKILSRARKIQDLREKENSPLARG